MAANKESDFSKKDLGNVIQRGLKDHEEQRYLVSLEHFEDFREDFDEYYLQGDYPQEQDPVWGDDDYGLDLIDYGQGFDHFESFGE